MSAGGIFMKRRGDSAIKINMSLTFMGESECTSLIYNIENLVQLQFKAKAEMLHYKNIISYSFQLSKHDSAKGKSIKVNIVNKNGKYSVIDIDAPDSWSEWQPMGCGQPLVSPNTPKVYRILETFVITAYEDKKNAILSKLYTDTDFTDFRLSTSEGSVAVHKAYMAAHSEVFKAMLTKEWKETAEGKINIQGATVQTLEQLKDYMYLGIVPKEGLCPLLLVARLYLIEDLEKQCIRKLAESVTAKELYSLVQFACDNNIPELACRMLEITHDSVIDIAYALEKASLEKQSQIDNQELEEEEEDEEDDY